jgi:hypothetical protein
MKSRLTGILILSLNLLFGAPTSANESAQLATPQPKSKRLAQGLSFFVNGIPMPVLSGGIGGALEYRPFEYLTFWAGFEREEESNSTSFSTIGPETKTINDNRFLALRGYFSGYQNSGFFITAGHKWSNVVTMKSNGIFSGPTARRENTIKGVYTGLGYRIALPSRKNFDWQLDMGVNYEPGKLKRANYTATFQPDYRMTSEVEPSFRYGFFPEVRLGATF